MFPFATMSEALAPITKAVPHPKVGYVLVLPTAWYMSAATPREFAKWRSRRKYL